MREKRKREKEIRVYYYNFIVEKNTRFMIFTIDDSYIPFGINFFFFFLLFSSSRIMLMVEIAQ